MRLGHATLARTFLALVFMLAGLKPSAAQILALPDAYIVDNVTYHNIGEAYNQCANIDTKAVCEIWDYNLLGGEVMNTLPWPADGSGTPFDLHLGPGTLTICSASPCLTTAPLTFVIPPLSRVTGVGRNGAATTAGTVIKAGANFTPSARQSLVQLGSISGGSPKTSFGSLLSSVTVDCNKKSNCIAIENVGAQEQGGIEHVNAVNYAVFGVWFHGSGAQNSHMFDVEVNGCTSASSCLITPTTVPLEIDNVPSLRPIVGITVNPVNTLGGSITTAAWSSTGGGTATYTISMTGTLTNTDWVAISGVLTSTGGTGYDGTYQVSSPLGAPNTTSFTVTPIPNPGTFSSGMSPNASFARVPVTDVVVCSGTCPDSATPPGDSTSPTPVTFVGAHAEHGRYGFDVKGSAAALNLVGSSCPNSGGYSSVSVCALIEAGIQSAHIENFYPGPATLSGLEDDNFATFNSTQNFIQLYDIGSSSGGNNANRTRHCSELDCTDHLAGLVAQSNASSETPFTIAPGPAVTLSAGIDLLDIYTTNTSGTPSGKAVSVDNAGILNVAGHANFTQGAAPSSNAVTFTGFNGSSTAGTAQVLIAGGGSSDNQIPLQVNGTDTSVVTAVVNGPASATADLFDVNLNGTSKLKVLAGGATQCVANCQSGTFQGNLSGTAVIFESGISGTAAASVQGALTVRGGSWTSGSTAGSTAGSATMQGGDDLSTANSGTTTAGNLTLRPGQVTANGASATAVNGNLVVAGTAIKDSGYTAGDLACVTSTTSGGVGKVGSCNSTTTNAPWIGILLAANGNSATYQVLGDAVVNSQASTTFTANHYACLDGTNAGKVVDSATHCVNLGTGVGIVKITDPSNTTSHTIVIARF